MTGEPANLRIDLERLLNPISVEHPAGESLRYEGTYDQVRAARREDDAELSQGIYVTDLKRADWPAVQKLCLDALETRSKDLQLAAWLLEAWLHLYGFAGVAEGFKLLGALCDGFWDDLHPQLDGDDLEYRLAPLEWINEKLTLKLKQIVLTAPQTGNAPAYAWADWESACQLDQQTRRDPKAMQLAEAKGKVTTARFQNSVMLTPKAFYARLDEELSYASDAIAVLENLLDAKCGKQAPSLFQFKDTLGAIHQLVFEVLRVRQDENGYDALGEGHFEEPQEEMEDGEFYSGGPIRSRAEAYRRLAEAAEYLLRTEPHSPTPYLVKRAVAWGSMSLHEVLGQIVRNDNEMQELNRLLRFVDEERNR